MRYILIITFILSFNLIKAQDFQFEQISGRLRLDIKVPPPDTTVPTISLKLPSVLSGYPIYHRDTILVLEGILNDNNNSITLSINDQSYGKFPNGAFNVSTKLTYGENKLTIKAEDRKGNSVSSDVNFFQDPTADVVAPIIQIEEPAVYDERGIKVIKKIEVADTSFYLKGRIIDESGILGLWINNSKPDSLIDNYFVHKLNSSYLDSIIIVAADGYGNVSSKTLFKQSRYSETLDELDSSPQYHALLLAVNNYDDRLIIDLDNPIDDAKLISATLNKYYTFDKKNIQLLQNPSRADIIKAFQELRNNLSENDNLLIFFAGHGHYNNEIEQGYWLPSDAQKNDETNWIPSYTVRDFIKGIHTQHTLVISDACFAGAIFDTRNVMNQAPKSIQEIYKYPSRKALTSGLFNQVPDKSVFVEYLNKRLIENESKYLDAEKLYIRIKDAVIQNGITGQNPEYKPIKLTGDEGVGHFIFIKREY